MALRNSKCSSVLKNCSSFLHFDRTFSMLGLATNGAEMVKVQRSNFLHFVILVLIDVKEVIQEHMIFFFTNEEDFYFDIRVI